MKLIIQLYNLTLEKPEVVSVYVGLGGLILTGLGLLVNKAVTSKKIFKQRSGANSQNVQGEKVNVTMGENKWK
jgi:hypothetical protein